MAAKKITTFNFKSGDILGGKYRVLQRVGKGWEGEVYLVKDKHTGIEHAAKFFFPHRNKQNKNLKFFARKLHKLRRCSMLMKYSTQETIEYKGQKISFLVSEFVEGELLSDYVKRKSGKRLRPFEALHVLYALVSGMEDIHKENEYHGDIHLDNIIIERVGLEFHLKLIDLYQWKTPKTESKQDDIVNMIQVFYDILGGKKWYSKQPDVVKKICMGVRRPSIVKKFRTIEKLKHHIEHVDW